MPFNMQKDVFYYLILLDIETAPEMSDGVYLREVYSRE